MCFLFLEARGGVSGLWADGADAQPLCSGPGTGCCGFGSVLRPWGEKVRQSSPFRASSAAVWHSYSRMASKSISPNGDFGIRRHVFVDIFTTMLGFLF